jgi:hypothetical protein
MAEASKKEKRRRSALRLKRPFCKKEKEGCGDTNSERRP